VKRGTRINLEPASVRAARCRPDKDDTLATQWKLDATMPLHTNQAAAEEIVAGAGCGHGPGKGDQATCRYLRALAALQTAIAEAERAYQQDPPTRRILGELWLLLAEVSSAHDSCPSTSHFVHAGAA
jgi:hypothetical protein